MTDVPDPQPPAPEASVDELAETVRYGLGAHWLPSSVYHAALDSLTARLRGAERERDEARVKEQGWAAAAELYREGAAEWGRRVEAAEARVRELEEALTLLRSELDWLIGFATPGIDEADENAWQNRLVEKLNQARALAGKDAAA